MAKPKKHKKRKHHGSGSHPAAGGSPEKALAELRIVIANMLEAESGPDAASWGEAQHALMKTRADRQEVMRLIASRNVAGLSKLADALEAGSTHVEPEPTAPAEEPLDPDIDHETLRHAFRAFRKRLKLARLDDESRLSVSPMTGGKHSRIQSILAPREYPDAVWRALAAQGKLKDIGQGFYELAEAYRDD